MEKGRISSFQMSLLIYPAVVATGILTIPRICATQAEQDLWLSPIIASLIGFFSVYVAHRLHRMYPNETVIQYSERIVGKIPGKLICFFLIFFYIQLTGEITRAYGEFIVSYFLLETPIGLVVGLMLLLCAISVTCGLEVIGRLGQLFFPIFILPLIVLFLMLGPDLEMKNVLPVLENGILPAAKGAVILNNWYSEFFLIAFFLPFVSDQKNGFKYSMVTVVGVTATFVAVNLVTLLVLGSATASKVYPLMIVGRYISLFDFFENLESVVMAIWIFGAFVKTSVFYYVSASAFAQWLNLSDYRPVVWPLGIVMAELAFWGLPSTMAYGRYLQGAAPFYTAVIQVGIPLFLLLVAILRSKKGTSPSG